MTILSAVLLIGIGLVACFFGKKLYRVVLGLFGFVTGYYIASGLLLGQSDIVHLLGSIAVGVVLFIVFYALYKFAYILFGAFLGLAAGALLAHALDLTGVVYLIVAVVLAIIGGVLGNIFADPIIRLATAFGGAIQVIAGVGGLAAAIGLSLPLVDVSHASTAQTSTTALIVSLVLVGLLGVVGFVFQTRQHD